MAKLIVVIMGPGKESFLEMCRDSVKGADDVLFFTSNKDLVDAKKVFFNNWDDKDPTTNGKARNFYLDYLKEFHPKDWALILDEDELVEDLDKVKEFIKTAEPGLYSVKMRHFIGDLGHEDSTHQTHYVPNRLFKISEASSYPLHSHPVLDGENWEKTECTTIWHLGHLPVDYMDYVLKRYKEHASNSRIHTQQFLEAWRDSHLFGMYPVRQINPVELPKQIVDRYEIDKDKFYFANRNLETKHFIDAIHWRDFFKPKNAIEIGCGKGPRVFALNHVGVPTIGFEISNYAVQNKMYPQIFKADLLKMHDVSSDLVIAYDLLEHIDYKDIDLAIDNLVKFSKKNILISVPVIGDPNLELDSTHKIKETKEWWEKKFVDRGLKKIEVPHYFLFKNQLMIFEKEEK